MGAEGGRGRPGATSDYYWIFPDRTMPDAYEQTVREIFPDDHPGSFRAAAGRPVGLGDVPHASSGT